jgi:hypothetical protein
VARSAGTLFRKLRSCRQKLRKAKNHGASGRDAESQHDEHNPTVNSTVSEQPNTSSKTGTTSGQDKEAESDPPMTHWWRVAEVWFSGIVAAFTVALVVTSIFQYDAARKAARRAMQANQIASRALMDVQRASISETNIEVLGGKGPAAQVLQGVGIGTFQGIGNANLAEGVILVQFQNSGSTPGVKVVENANFCISKSDMVPDFSFRDLSDINRHNRTYVAPKATFVSFTPITSNQVEEILTLKTPLFVWGWITYDDVFGNHHRSEYCARYQGVWKAPDNSFTWVADQCTPSNPHSCTDKNCPKKWGNTDAIDCDNHPLK